MATADGATVLTVLWWSSGCLAAGLVAAMVLRRRAARAHQVLVLCMLAGMLAPLGALLSRQFGWGLREIPAGPVAGPSVASDVRVAPRVGEAPTAESATPARSAVDAAAVVTAVPASTAAPELGSRRPTNWWAVVYVVWGLASAVLALRLALSLRAARRLVATARVPAGGGMAEAADTSARELGLAEGVHVAASQGVATPVVWAWGRQAVLLLPARCPAQPGSVGGWRAVICHEFAHLRRRDHLSGLLAEVLCGVLPWQPLAWVVRAWAIRLSEEACDDWVAAAGLAGPDYAEALLDLGPGRQPAVLPAVASGRRALAARVRRLLDGRCADPRVGPVWHAVVGSAVCLTIAGAAMAQTQVVAPAAAPEAAEVPEAVGAWPERPGVTAAGETLRVGRGEVQDATTIRGRVTDEFGTGIGGARVQVYNLFAGSRDFPLQRMSDDCGTPPDCLTDREGGFALPIEAGTVCDLWIEKSGFAVAFCQSVSPGAAPLDVQMGRGARLTGVVRSRHGQRLVPASGETVRLSLAPRDGMWVGCVTERRTEADGSYAFGVSAPPEGRVWEVSFAGKAVAVGIRDGEQPDRVDFVVATEAEAKPAQAEAGAGRPGETTNTIGLELILVQPGRLTIPDRQAGGTKTLTVAAPFYLGKFEVTQAQWEQVMGSNPSRYSGPDRPVERVNWLDASEFCRRLSLLEKRTYRLPSADEWEYACRAGSTAEFCYGDDATTLGDYAWYGANSGKGVDGQGNAVDGSTRPVGQKKPNAWGFCDMQGNVNEWVAGEYDPPAQTRKQWSERSGRPADTPWRTYRGGCFFHDATACRCSWWTFYPQTDSSWVIGFRVALDVTATQGTE